LDATLVIRPNQVTANGGLIAPSGCRIIASAANHYSTPVVVLAGLYKLSPIYPIDEDSLNLFTTPEHVYPFKEGLDARISNPFYDYVDPSMVSLFITNVYFSL
jgi:translation initiation factor eIF-2B subunit beta